MTNLSETKDASIYNEIVRLEFAQGAKTCLFSYFTINEKSRYSAEKALSFCENDKEKLSYLNNILILIKNSVSPEKFETQSVNDEEKGKFNDPLEEFVQKLELKQLEQYRPLKNENLPVNLSNPISNGLAQVQSANAVIYITISPILITFTQKDKDKGKNSQLTDLPTVTLWNPEVSIHLKEIMSESNMAS